MKLDNFRGGFACNSSSSHSLVFLPEGTKASDDSNGQEFGWDRFTLASQGAKSMYVGQLLRHSLEKMGVDVGTIKAVVRAWTGAELDTEGYIDHQSVYALPRARAGIGVDEDFFREFHELFMQKNLAVLGGNDNDDGTHPLSRFGTAVSLPMPLDTADRVIARKDPEHGFWTVFNMRTGGKVRFRFDADKSVAPVEKASRPELIDVKITNRCPFGCSYCYQSSTPDGKAGLVSNWEIARVIADLGVFEVAYGGGEPTLDPRFWDLLRETRKVGVIPNFTTKNLSWLRDPKSWRSAIEVIGSFAYSVTNTEDVAALGALLGMNGIPHDKAIVQHVVGTSCDMEGIMRAARKLGIRMTLLGFKRSGFGAKHHLEISGKTDQETDAKHATEFARCLDSLNKSRELPELSVDTALIGQAYKELQRRGVPDWCMMKLEGKFSMYWDTVENRIGPSSYCDGADMIELPKDSAIDDAVSRMVLEFKKW